MNLKTGLVLLVVLALCFFVGVGNGLLRTNDSSTGNAPPWSRRLDSLFPRGKITFNNVSGSSSCLNSNTRRLTVPAGQTCRYTLSTGRLPRKISLKLSEGTSVIIRIYQPVDGTPKQITEETLGVGTSMEFRVPTRQSKADRDQLEISCLDLTNQCVLQILE
jgi:hypothetical protein